MSERLDPLPPPTFSLLFSENFREYQGKTGTTTHQPCGKEERKEHLRIADCSNQKKKCEWNTHY
jgi:hypothetical protein